MVTRAPIAGRTRPTAATRRAEAIALVRKSLDHLRAKLNRAKVAVTGKSASETRFELANCKTLEDEILRAIDRHRLDADLFLLRLAGIREIRLEIQRGIRKPRKASRPSQESAVVVVEPIPRMHRSTPEWQVVAQTPPAKDRRGGDDLRIQPLFRPTTEWQLAVAPPPAQEYRGGDNSHLHRFLNDAARRLTDLCTSLKQSNLAEAEIQLEKAKSRVLKIGDMIIPGKVDAAEFFEEMQLLEDLLIEINRRIESMKNVWWRKAWGFLRHNFVQILSPVGAALGLPSFGHTQLLGYQPSSGGKT